MDAKASRKYLTGHFAKLQFSYISWISKRLVSFLRAVIRFNSPEEFEGLVALLSHLRAM